MTCRTLLIAALLTLSGSALAQSEPQRPPPDTPETPSATPPETPSATPPETPSATPSDTPAPTTPAALQVGVAGSAPFVISNGARLTGLSIDVWESAARPLGRASTYRQFPSADAVIEAVEKGEIDAAIGPLSITRSRARRVSFTQPWMQAGIGIATPQRVGIWPMISGVFSRGVLFGLGLLASVLIVVGVLFWVTERKKNPAFDHGATSGVGNGIWLALVTMTTVGYGDIAPVTPAGRVIGGAWMLIAMVTASSLTAGIATILTLSQITSGVVQTPSDFANRSIGAVDGTIAVRFIRRNNGRAVTFETLEEAVDAARAGEVVAVAHDRPILAHLIREQGRGELTMMEASWETQGYGFAFPLGDPLRHEIDLELLGQHESHAIDALIDTWL